MSAGGWEWGGEQTNRGDEHNVGHGGAAGAGKVASVRTHSPTTRRVRVTTETPVLVYIVERAHLGSR